MLFPSQQNWILHWLEQYACCIQAIFASVNVQQWPGWVHNSPFDEHTVRNDSFVNIKFPHLQSIEYRI